MSAYSQGRTLEWKVRDALVAAGYEVIRSAGSKGAVDLIAIKVGQLVFCQVKRTTAPGPLAWNKLFDLAAMVAAVPVLATCEPRKAIRYERLTARKTTRGRAPLEPFVIDFGETP